MKKNITLDIAKGLAIILVVYGHVIEHTMAPQGQDFFHNPVFMTIYTFHMPLFVFISGYLMGLSLSRKTIRDVFQSRCKSLFVPFICLSFLGGLVMLSLHAWSNEFLTSPQVWFLWTLFVLSALLTVSLKLEKYLGVFAFALVWGLLLVFPRNNASALYYVQWFYLFYLSGYFAYRCQLNIFPRQGNLIVLGACLVAFFWLIRDWRETDYIYINKMQTMTWRLVYRYLMGFLGIMIAFDLAGLLSRTPVAGILAAVGAYSLDIYILQMFFLEGIYPRLVARMHVQLDFNSTAVLCLFTPALTVVFTGMCFFFSRHILRKSRLLNLLLLGGRAQ